MLTIPKFRPYSLQKIIKLKKFSQKDDYLELKSYNYLYGTNKK
ncbi:hypothetical protein NTHI1209_00063 [Haemophilus influenzae]|uniref:Uncharacterized protein n=1 Tax=Haemophilus influenzae TaxID=727 RepID=A0A158T0K4_HAEIF|nr:hypothetical protein NTHI1209_00063 [Haemophilus influenzae]